MKYYIIAGEASGDMHGANLISAIKKKDVNADFRCWGGDRIKKETGALVKHYNTLDFMGFIEVLMNLKSILNNLIFCKKDILYFKPDLLILINYPGFNLRVAKFEKKNNIKVCYYISPQVWAWNKQRVNKIKKYIDKLIVVLPFEKEFYIKYNIQADFIGHPLVDEIRKIKNSSKNTFYNKYNLDTSKKIVALLPGSRKQEIQRVFPIMTELAIRYNNFHFVVASVNSQFPIKLPSNVKVVYNDTYSLLKASTYAVVTSGTATLETALFKVPQVVCYKANFFSFFIAKLLVDLKYISLVNLIMNKKVVTELIQGECNINNLNKEFDRLQSNQEIEKIKKSYSKLDQILEGRNVSDKVASAIMQMVV